jgi:hypothetical protein
MKQTVTLSKFRDAFMYAGRDSSWSHEGLEALYDYFTRLEEDLGEEIELDVVAIDCEFCEYDSVEQLWTDYHNQDEPAQTEDDITEFLSDFGVVIELSNGGVIVDNR